MPIPSYVQIMLPLLKITAENPGLHISEAVDKVASFFNLTEAERSQLFPSKKQAVIFSRTGWARTYLKKAGLIASPSRGHLIVTERGLDLLKENLPELNNRILERFPEFLEFIKGELQITGSNEIAGSTTSPQSATPDELLESSYIQLKNNLIQELLEKARKSSPAFFEQLVVDVIVGMGYGGSREDAGRAIGKSGDEGIDGIINEDRLGLDVIYLQAKRWDANIGRPEVQKFAGALQGKRARKGIFITTSDFTNESREYVKNIDIKIILISGMQLAELMWEYEIGVNTSVVYKVKKLDADYLLD